MWNGFHTRDLNEKGKVKNLTIKRRMRRELEGKTALLTLQPLFVKLIS